MLVTTFPSVEARRVFFMSGLEVARADGHIAHAEYAALDALAKFVTLDTFRGSPSWPAGTQLPIRARRLAYGIAEWMSWVDGFVVPAEREALETLRIRFELEPSDAAVLGEHAAYVDAHTRSRALTCPWQAELEHLSNRILAL
jgi:tellurite resistance protein